jgi:hypothetical protein
MLVPDDGSTDPPEARTLIWRLVVSPGDTSTCVPGCDQERSRFDRGTDGELQVR